jgi:hypothetical protein
MDLPSRDGPLRVRLGPRRAEGRCPVSPRKRTRSRAVHAGIIYNTNTPQGGLEFARDEVGKSCPDPTIVSEQKVHLRDAL